MKRARGQRLKWRQRRDLKRAFLKQYQARPNVAAICREIGVARGTLYAWLARDPRFAADVRAIRFAREVEEEAAFQRWLRRAEQENQERQARILAKYRLPIPLALRRRRT